MRHRARVKHFSRESGPRKALIRGLVISLVEHGRIKTTLAKAKELRRHVEKAITMGKKGTLHSRRILMSRFPHEETVSTIMSNLGPRFKEREGGYTRILKLGLRPGDKADMAFIQFVDYSGPVKSEKTDVELKKETRKVAHLVEMKRKRIRNFQENSRKIARG